MSNAWSFETKQIHAGQSPDGTTNARALPIYQTTSYTFNDTTHAANLFGLKELGNIYTRIMNPTQAVVEDRIAALEGGVAALLVASGQAAETLAILNIAEAGDHIVSSPSLYGGTYNLFHYTLPKLGITTTFVENPDDPESWRAAVQPNTKLFFGESIANPKNDILDIEAVAARRPRGRRAADHRQHRRHPVPDPAARVGRRHRRPLGDQVPRRARHVGRRRDRRRRHLRLRPVPRALPELQPARPELPRPGLRARPRRRLRLRREPVLHPQGPRPAAARPRRGGLAVQRLPHRPGHRDAVPAHRAARRRTPRPSPTWLEGRDEVESVNYAGLPVEPVVRARARSTRRWAPAPCSPSRSRAASRPARRSSRRSSCTATSPTSATSAAS